MSNNLSCLKIIFKLKSDPTALENLTYFSTVTACEIVATVFFPDLFWRANYLFIYFFWPV